MTCERCRTEVKNWNGDDRQCAFKAGVFSSDNWNCATMNALRDVAEERSTWNGDQNAAILPLGDCGDFVVLGWYKRRGRTEAAWFMSEDLIRPLALTEALECIEQSNRR